MKYLTVKNWDRFQRYRKDRGAPPWIALHRRLQRDPEWMVLTSEQRGWLVDIWMLAAEREGKFPADPVMLQRLCGMDSTPDLDALQHFIKQPVTDDGMTVDVQRTDSGRPMDCPETETETETEKKEPRARGTEPCYFEQNGLQAEWGAFVEMRKEKKKPINETAKRRLIAKHKRFVDEGHDPVEIIEQSTEHNWTGFFPVKNEETADPLPADPNQVEAWARRNGRDGPRPGEGMRAYKSRVLGAAA